MQRIFRISIFLVVSLLATQVYAAGKLDALFDQESVLSRETELATQAYQAGDYQQAIAHFRKVVKASPKDPMAWHFLGLSLAKSGDTAGAKKAYERVLQLQPNSPVADLTRGLLDKLPMRDCRNCPEMVRIPGRSYAMGKYEVTQKEWRAVMGHNPSKFTSCGDNCPVERVSWNDVQEFLQKLNAKTSKQYRLQTEAEWEYACYGGSQSEYCGGNDVNAVAWISDNSNKTTHPVGQKQANGYGLYDMSGNVWEWMSNCWEGGCAKREFRGGSWIVDLDTARAAGRYGNTAEDRYVVIGFRLARTLQ